MVEGGAAGLRLERWRQPRLLSNQQGGFGVACPDTGDNITRAFSAAVTAWRAGGPRTMRCAACGSEHGLEEALGRPPFAIARAAVVFARCGGSDLTEAGWRMVRDLLGETTLVWRRVG